MTVGERRARFRELHQRDRLFVMPNPWDVGSARLLETLGFEALATTSSGLAWSLGKLDQQVTREELIAHVRAVADATEVPLNVDSERCYPNDSGGIAETVEQLADAGASGFSIEDYDPAVDAIDDLDAATQHVAIAAEAAHGLADPLVLTVRCENHLVGAGDLDDTIDRLLAYRGVGADVLYAPGLVDVEQIRKLVDAVGVPVNVLALPSGPSIAELESIGVRRVSTGGALARAAYGALVSGARELQDEGTSRYSESGAPRDVLAAAFGRR